MRIVSQNNIYNLPYDLIVIQRKERAIYAHMMGESYVLGTYSTEEKAKRVFSQILIQTYNIYGDSYKLPKDEHVKLDDEE